MKIKALALAGIIGIGSLGLTTGVSAAPTTETKANVFFEENNEITLPVHPEDPDHEYSPEVDEDGEDEIVEGTPGPLSIDYASHINFGSVEISGNTETYYANPITFVDVGAANSAPYVQVTDNRGTKTGWELQVSQTAEFATEGGTELSGAELTLVNGDDSVNSNSDVTNVTATDVTFENFEEAYPVVTAANGSGAGTFTNQFGELEDIEGFSKATSVSLVVPGDLVIEDDQKYSTELNWTLEDGPQN